MDTTPLNAPSNDAVTWPARRVVARYPGSLPMGGMVHDTPIHAFETSPLELRLSSRHPTPTQRRDLELGGYLGFVIDGVVSAEEAQHLIAASEHFGYREEAPGIATPPGMRMNKTVHWMADDLLLAPLMQRLQALLPQHIDGARLHPRLSHRLNMYRYDDNDVFNRHIDGDWPGFSLDPERRTMTEWPQARSCLTMLLYLNDASDGVCGGQTQLLHREGHWVDVLPRKGSALFFRHGFTPDSVPHIGARVHGPVPKYVARINVMYQAEA